jgi:hypothetical protein
MYIPRNWEFGSALAKLRNFGGFEHPNPPLHAADHRSAEAIRNAFSDYFVFPEEVLPWQNNKI